MTAPATGYAHPDYVRTLDEFGEPIVLAGSGAPLLVRDVDGGRSDAMGPYPVLTCPRWDRLATDLDDLGGRLVSVAAVVDPLTAPPDEDLRKAFPDHLVDLKRHAVVDVRRRTPLAGHHRRRVAAAAAVVDVERCQRPEDHLDAWVDLYADLVVRHGIGGMRRFSRSSFARLLRVPGLHAWRGCRDGRTVCMTLWLVDGAHAWYHLGASSAEGYAAGASYAVVAAALDDLSASGVERIDLGGSSGAGADDGLWRFKSGWATDHVVARFGGRITDRRAYAELCAARPGPRTAWFPAYRAGEGTPA